MAKFSKDLLKKAKKAAREAGTNVTSNSREKRNEKRRMPFKFTDPKVIDVSLGI